MVLGYRGLEIYSQLRKLAITQIIQERSQVPIVSGHVELVKGDYFHDTQDVLKIVHVWHDHLRRYMRPTDLITTNVLAMVDDTMLKATSRIDAQNLCKHFDHILQETQPAVPPDELIGVALQEVDRALQSLPLPPAIEQKHQAGLPFLSRESRKSQTRSHAIMRSEYFTGTLGTFETTAAAVPGSIRKQRRASKVSETVLEETEVHTAHSQVPTTVQAPLQSSSTREPQATPTPQRSVTMPANSEDHEKVLNVFQARAQLQKKWPWSSKRKDDYLQKFVHNRDVIFVADNSGSMEEYWDEATQLLEVLVQKVAPFDKDGIDLYLSSKKMIVNGEKDYRNFSREMSRETNRPHISQQTSMSGIIDMLLNHYLEKIQHKGIKNVKDLTIIVLTDGKFDNMSTDLVERKIIEFVEAWRKIGGSQVEHRNNKKHRTVGIQFVQFGEDDNATFRLQHLDNDLPSQGIPDIVDTEPARRDIYKMIVGSFVDDIDSRNPSKSISSTNSSSPPSAPVTQAGWTIPSVTVEGAALTSSPPSLATQTLQRSPSRSSRAGSLPNIQRLPSAASSTKYYR